MAHPAVPLADRFWPKVDKAGPVPAHAPDLGPCWIWTGARTPSGYGRISGPPRPGRRPLTLKAPTVALELALGRSIRRDRFTLHRCDNPPCVNPRHLHEGTYLQNAIDMRERGRNGGPGRGAAHFRARLTNDQAAAIRHERAAGAPLAAIAERYGVSLSTASEVSRGNSYQEPTE